MKTNRLLPVRTVRIVKLLLVSFFTAIISYVFLFPQLFSCQIIPFSGFLNIHERIFISQELKPAQYRKILKAINAAEMRIDSFYSGRKSRPAIIICSDSNEYEKYCSGGEGAGCSLGTPWGETFIVLNLQGINVDVVSHEMSHIELLNRLGWWKTTMQVPQWFNEGLALMVDRRFVSKTERVGRYLDYCDEWLYYTGGGQFILELNKISKLKEFFSGSQKDIMLAYMTSGMEISYWLAAMEENGFLNFLAMTESGLSFENAYHESEKQNRSEVREKLPVNPLRTDKNDL